MLRQADGSCNAKAGLRAQSVRRTGEAGYRARSLLRRGRFWRAALQCNYCRRHRVLARNSAWALLATANDLRHIDAICGVTIPVVGTVCLSRPINARVKTTGTSRVLESLRPGSQTTPLIPVRNCRRMRRVHDNLQLDENNQNHGAAGPFQAFFAIAVPPAMRHIATAKIQATV